jgi:hypothetical protein
LFVKNNVTKEIRAMHPTVAKEIKTQRKILRGKLPKIDIGPHCSKPYECDFKDHCWVHIPEDSVFDLAGKGLDPFTLYRQGIIRQMDIPLDRLNAKQHQQVEATLQQRNTINEKKLRAFLNELWYPLCFLDFETFQCTVPHFDGTRPYQQIPFQYSLHLLKRKGGKLHHREYLASPGADQRREFLERLLEDIPEDACILTWNQSFEKMILEGLAKVFPRDNLRDLMVPFRRRDVYFWEMKGSYSIKKVLPALVPDMSYEGLAIDGGGAAMEGWWRMCAAESREEVGRIRKDLLEYCKMDTLGMVEIYKQICIDILYFNGGKYGQKCQPKTNI